jgi:proline dehydrogenase
MPKTHHFDNIKVAFALKNNFELNRAYYLFKMLSYQSLVNIGSSLTHFALKLNLPVQGLIKKTVFNHFCGGVNEDDCLYVIDSLYTKRVCSVLDYSVEGKESEDQFDDARDKILKIIRFADEKDAMPIVVFKPTGFGRFALFQKIGEQKKLSEEEQNEWNRVVERYNSVCKLAKELDIKVLIDGEESWMQDAADDLAEQMMALYNTKTPVVYNTLQTYRWDRVDYLKRQHEKAQAKGYKLGFKVVRGAYMEKERERAIEKGYASPICENKKATDDCFNTVMTYCLNNLDDISIFIGSHNEQSNYLAMEIMDQFNVAKDDNRVWFGQLYGMSDHISYNLSDMGYNVAKYLPFGPVKDVMPYLIRRAQENTSVAGQTGRELTLLMKERKRRKENK